MFEAAELGRSVSKEDYEAKVPKLRAGLLEAQFRLRSSKLPVIIIVTGADGAGKGDVVHRLNEWLDPRGIDTQAFWLTSDEESERPPYWRFWRVLPARGRIGVFFGSWYTRPIVRRLAGKLKNRELDAELDRIAGFERMLAEDGAVIIKLWLHLSVEEQARRFRDVEKNPEKHWRILPTDWHSPKLHSRFREISERAVRHTDSAVAPWQVVEAGDDRYRDLTVGQIVLSALRAALKQKVMHGPKVTAKRTPRAAGVSVLDRVDLSQALAEDDYARKLEKYQTKLNRLTWAAYEKRRSMVLVFEGWDAAGKGSSIRRVTEAIDPRLFRIFPVASPTDEERAHHYLWRFWRHLPRAGMIRIYDRSWYGRVLVERIEGYAREDEWKRAYHEINDFEEQLVEDGMVLGKFWLHISKEEQLRRFKQREEVSFKRYKITPDDWRNRAKWDQYSAAVNEMVRRTSTKSAPWTLVAGNDKKFARIQILKTICKSLEEAL
ncbi:polyphosphate:AMP phosphotransferase [Verrucomicrobiota bacterium]|nr:polyphosphate:AMP phosphotransferase [Verrucomicrobiota bacterium]